MTNKTKAAIEEAAKLPTAEQMLESKPNNSKYKHFYHGAFVLQIMEEYTAAHTAGLLADIQAIQVKANEQKYEATKTIGTLGKENSALRERVKELEGATQPRCVRIRTG